MKQYNYVTPNNNFQLSKRTDMTIVLLFTARHWLEWKKAGLLQAVWKTFFEKCTISVELNP